MLIKDIIMCQIITFSVVYPTDPRGSLYYHNFIAYLPDKKGEKLFDITLGNDKLEIWYKNGSKEIQEKVNGVWHTRKYVLSNKTGPKGIQQKSNGAWVWSSDNT